MTTINPEYPLNHFIKSRRNAPEELSHLDNKFECVVFLGGVSGSGKSHFAEHMMYNYPNHFVKCLQCTTRDKRHENESGYDFLTFEEYNKRKPDLFVKTQIGNNLYGTVVPRPKLNSVGFNKFLCHIIIVNEDAMLDKDNCSCQLPILKIGIFNSIENIKKDLLNDYLNCPSIANSVRMQRDLKSEYRVYDYCDYILNRADDIKKREQDFINFIISNA